MSIEKLKSDIMDLYYGESDLSLKEIALKHGVSLHDCQLELQNLLLVSKCYRDMKEYAPSQMSLNKIMAHAREQAQTLQKTAWWHVLLKPAYTFSLVLVLGFAGTAVWYSQNQQQPLVASVETPVKNDLRMSDSVKERLFKTPLDFSEITPKYNIAPKRKYFNPYVSEVSLGNHNDEYFADDELDQKMLSQNLNSQDLETLFFRARKLEKQGYFEEALRDYVYLSKNSLSFEYQKAMPLAIARCYEGMGDKKTALSILESFERTYGSQDDLKLWKDQLKSETF